MGEEFEEFDEEVEEKLEYRERRYEVEQRMKQKRSEEYEVLEEVFDKPTLMTIYHLMNRGVIDKLYGAVAAGKESRVYWGVSRDGKDLAVKIFLIVSAEFRKGMLTYIEGDPRFTLVKKSTRALIYTWASKEFKNLQRAYEAGVRVPKPIAIRNNVLVMEFIGEEGVPAPLVRDVELPKPKAVYEDVLENVKKLYQKAELVHGDLSEYNLMFWRGRAYMFDMSQAVSVQHPRAQEFLKRDIHNISRFFEKLGVRIRPVERVFRWIVSDVRD